MTPGLEDSLLKKRTRASTECVHTAYIRRYQPAHSHNDYPPPTPTTTNEQVLQITWHWTLLLLQGHQAAFMDRPPLPHWGGVGRWARDTSIRWVGRRPKMTPSPVAKVWRVPCELLPPDSRVCGLFRVLFVRKEFDENSIGQYVTATHADATKQLPLPTRHASDAKAADAAESAEVASCPSTASGSTAPYPVLRDGTAFGLPCQCLDAAFLDLPAPHMALPNVLPLLKPNGVPHVPAALRRRFRRAAQGRGCRGAGGRCATRGWYEICGMIYLEGGCVCH